MPHNIKYLRDSAGRPLDQDDIERECAAIIKVDCPLCRAPKGSHCASMANTIVWPPHLTRMDAYTHRLDPYDDWPEPARAITKPMQYVKNVSLSDPSTNIRPSRLLWKTLVEHGLHITNEYGRPLNRGTDDPQRKED
ncbi:hypothetical protein [Dyella sp. ASV21]|uniref:hypothetical protein n=1 Tax=Dyella sp. ASV21 TaxID=2795114 RepID=UPI0018EAC3BB|nr:hypothetical protein [Dyella sp. ASV21]